MAVVDVQITEFVVIFIRHQLVGEMGRIVGQEQGEGRFVVLPALHVLDGLVGLVLRRPFPRLDLFGAVHPVVGVQVLVAGAVGQPVVKALSPLSRRRVSVPLHGPGLGMGGEIQLRRVQMPFPDIAGLVAIVLQHVADAGLLGL